MERIGRYLVTGRLGAGAFATVWAADDPSLQVPVAIKVLADNLADDADIRGRFIREARMMRSIDSPRVATVYDIAELPDGRPYIVLELAVRGTLAQRIAAARTSAAPPSTEQVRAIVRGLAAALEAVHAAGIVHRDVKPSNVLLRVAAVGTRPDLGPSNEGDGALLREDEILMLTDFGIARGLDLSARLTALVGTAGYSAPEQRTPGAPVDHRADVFAASVLVAELLGASRQLDGFSGPELVDGLAVAPAVRAALARGLALSPADRPDTVEEWATELDGVLAPAALSMPGPPGLVPPHPGAPSAGPPRVRRRTVLAAGALAGGLALGTLGAALALRAAGGPRIVGPSQLRVGQQGGFVVTDAAPGQQWSWTAPEGEDREVLVVEPRTPGTFTVAARSADGRELESTVRVVPASDDLTVQAPPTARVGDRVTLRAGAPDGAELEWLVDGTRVPGASVTIEVRSPGVVTVGLLADTGGERSRVDHAVTVVP